MHLPTSSLTAKAESEYSHAAMNTRSPDEVPIERWDEGIPALNYK